MLIVKIESSEMAHGLVVRDRPIIGDSCFNALLYFISALAASKKSSLTISSMVRSSVNEILEMIKVIRIFLSLNMYYRKELLKRIILLNFYNKEYDHALFNPSP
jgi:hypothetical protein